MESDPRFANFTIVTETGLSAKHFIFLTEYDVSDYTKDYPDQGSRSVDSRRVHATLRRSSRSGTVMEKNAMWRPKGLYWGRPR